MRAPPAAQRLPSQRATIEFRELQEQLTSANATMDQLRHELRDAMFHRNSADNAAKALQQQLERAKVAGRLPEKEAKALGRKGVSVYSLKEITVDVHFGCIACQLLMFFIAMYATFPIPTTVSTHWQGQRKR